MTSENRRIKLTFTEELIMKPLINEVSQRFPIITNILQANITDKATTGWVVLDMSGTVNSLEHALSWLASEGVHVQLMHVLK